MLLSLPIIIIIIIIILESSLLTFDISELTVYILLNISQTGADIFLIFYI